MGWWSDVLADAIKRSGKLDIAACYTRSADKRAAFAAKYGCRAAASYEEILADQHDRGDHQHHAQRRASETTRAAAEAGKHVFLDKPIANTVARRRARSPRSAARRASCWRSAISAGAKAISAGSSGDRRRPLRQAGASRSQHQPRPARQDRPLLVALSGRRHAGRRHAADRHPLRRRAGIPDGAGQGGVAGSSPSSCCRATTPTSRA